MCYKFMIEFFTQNFFKIKIFIHVILFLCHLINSVQK
jgi:hypothetical protein